MSKERLEEIKKLRETILEENDFLTRCVLANVFVGLGYMDYLIQQAGRVQELESRIADDEHFVVEILEQNKRYRKALEEIRNYGTYELNNALKTSYAWIAHEALEEDNEPLRAEVSE